MTQNFTNISSNDIVGTSLDPLKNRDQAVKTSFMGTALPAVDSQDIGMQVAIIKTENNILTKQLWRLVGFEDNQPVWQIERDLTKGLVYSNNSSDKDIGDYQPINTLLTSLSTQEAGSSQTNINTFPYLSAKNTFSLATITATGRSLLAAADAAAARTTLGLGSLATKSAITGSDIATNAVTLSNLALGTYGQVISYSSSGVPTLVPLPAGVPVGAVIMWPSTVLPDNSWVFLAGQQLQIAEYQELWAFASSSNNIVSSLSDWQTNRPGSFYQESSTVFRVPNVKNMFIRAWDGPEGPTRPVGNKQAGMVGSHTHNLRVYGTGGSAQGGETLNTNNYLGSGTYNSKARLNGESSYNVENTTIVAPNTNDSDNRPVNVFYPFIMKARSQPV